MLEYFTLCVPTNFSESTYKNLFIKILDNESVCTFLKFDISEKEECSIKTSLKNKQEKDVTFLNYVLLYLITCVHMKYE